MHGDDLFGLGLLNPQVPIGAAPPVPVVPICADQCRNDLAVQAPNGTQRHPTAPIGTENIFSERTVPANSVGMDSRSPSLAHLGKILPGRDHQLQIGVPKPQLDIAPVAPTPNST